MTGSKLTPEELAAIISDHEHDAWMLSLGNRVSPRSILDRERDLLAHIAATTGEGGGGT